MRVRVLACVRARVRACSRAVTSTYRPIRAQGAGVAQRLPRVFEEWQALRHRAVERRRKGESMGGGGGSKVRGAGDWRRARAGIGMHSRRMCVREDKLPPALLPEHHWRELGTRRDAAD